MACQCENDRASCRCIFRAGLDVTLDGSGTASDPIIVHIAREYLTVQDGLNSKLTLLGTGSIQDPYLLRMEIDPALLSGLWTRWYGSRSTLNTSGPIPADTLAVVIPGA